MQGANRLQKQIRTIATKATPTSKLTISCSAYLAFLAEHSSILRRADACKTSLLQVKPSFGKCHQKLITVPWISDTLLNSHSSSTDWPFPVAAAQSVIQQGSTQAHLALGKFPAGARPKTGNSGLQLLTAVRGCRCAVDDAAGFAHARLPVGKRHAGRDVRHGKVHLQLRPLPLRSQRDDAAVPWHRWTLGASRRVSQRAPVGKGFCVDNASMSAVGAQEAVSPG